MYAAGSLALAALEFLVHVDEAEEPRDLVAVPAHIPGRIAVERRGFADLPPDWRRSPAPAALAQIGADWLARRVTAVLVVPSAIVAEEDNYVLNPAHPDFAALAIGPPRPFAFDPRLWKRR